ncbi:MAG: hypothetical protein FJ276_14280 [Planctomycetes bacterium]|nr:hypothetical protein [Planctomycetota bacterium]
MGVTISYRGSLAELDRVEDFEDRVLDLALEIGGRARVWRSVHDDDPRRVVRGVVLDLYPGQDTMSLLISPEGWLVNLFEIEDAEKGLLPEPPWCLVKTQFGPVEGHVAIVEMLTVLRREFFPNLEVSDEGAYWETRDLTTLRQKMEYLRSAIKGLADGLRRHGLTDEAAEDPEILLTRITRVARLVQRTLGRAPEHPPVDWNDDDRDGSFGNPADGTEEQWDAEFKEQRRKQERLHRRMEERRARGDESGDALLAAMRDEGMIDLPGEPSPSEAAREMLDAEDDDQDEPWRESLTDALREPDEDTSDDWLGDEDHHPLLERVMDLNARLYDLAAPTEGRQQESFRRLLSAAGEMLGGLAQALSDSDVEPPSGLALVQLKRALRGAAFAVGMLFPLRADGFLAPAAFDELSATLQSLQDDIYAELARLREAREAE